MKSIRLGAWLIVLLLILPAAVALALGATDSSKSGTSSVTLIDVPAPDLMGNIFANFTKDTGINLKYMDVTEDSMHSKMATLYASRSSDFDLSWSWAGYTAEFANAGFLEPISDKLSDDLKKDLNPGAYESVSFKGILYGLPRFMSMRSFYYNKKAFRDAGLDPEKPPKTWDEYVKVLKQVTRDTNNDGKIDIWGILLDYGAPVCCNITYELALNLRGGKVVDENGNVLFNNAAGVKALEDIVELHKLNVVDPASFGMVTGVDHVERFVTGNVATMFGWPNTPNYVNDPTKSKMVGELGMGIVPMVDGKSATLGGSEGYVLSKFSKSKEAAIKFLEYVANAKNQKDICLRTGWLPVRKSVLQDPVIIAKVPLTKIIAEQTQYPVARWGAPYADEIMNNALGPAILDAVQLKKAPKAALDEAAAKAKAIIDKFKK
jgi:multiple sugar transport system substrate-binding protein